MTNTELAKVRFFAGLHALHRGDLAVAESNLVEALRLTPNRPSVLTNLSIVYTQQERLSEALALAEAAVREDTKDALFWLQKGFVELKLAKYQDALFSLDAALERNASVAAIYNNRGSALKELRRLEEALASYDEAIRLKPDYAEAYSNRAIALKELRRLEEALASYDEAIRLKPDYAEAYSNRGNVLLEMSRNDDFLLSFEKAKSLKPDFKEALWNQANVLLLLGRFEQGFTQYEFRDSRVNYLKNHRMQRPQLTRNDDIKGKRILLWHELYLGDMIQFCRYGLFAEELGAHVTIAAPNKLKELLSTMSSSIKISLENTTDSEFDFQIPLMSTPLAFESWKYGFPAKVPYLKADAERVKKWKQQIGTSRFKIGICWQGSKQSEQSGRSLPLIEFYPLSVMEGVRLISLQKFDGVEQLQMIPADMRVEQLGDGFDLGPQSFLDTAAVMECLDLVITCDTSVAHLAGALGRPTWVLLKKASDWRWFLDRHDSPWYPTIRLFRQKAVGQWQSVFDELKTALESQGKL